MRAAVLPLVACLTASACTNDSTAPSDTSLGAAYLLSAVNGAAVPCCSHLTPDGKTEQWASSELDFTGPDAYTWTVKLRFDWQPTPKDFETLLVDSIASTGHYSHEGKSLLFSDSATSRHFSATVVADTIAIVDQGTTYRFRIEPPPSLSESIWAQASCNSVTGDNLGCAITDDSGVVSTAIGGGLQFDLNVPTNHYAWQRLYQRRRPVGVTDTIQVIATGSYLWDGTSLSMKDDSTGQMMTGRLPGGPYHLVVQSGATVVDFYRLFAPPPSDRMPTSH